MLPAGDTGFRVAVAVVAALLVAILFKMRFLGAIDLPSGPPPPLEARAASGEGGAGPLEIARRLDRDPGQYESDLARDSKLFGVQPPATPETMARVFPYRVDGNRLVLEPGQTAEVAGLRLGVRVQAGELSHRPLLVLDIENLGDRPLAYRIDTRPTRGVQPCRGKVDLEHNALAIAARGTESRSECVYRKGWAVEVRSVEVIELPALSYLYVSALVPERIGLEPRTARGHRPPPGLAACRDFLLPANIQRSLDKREITWRDMVDFYARHSCKNHVIPIDYVVIGEGGDQPSPVVGESY